MDGVRRNCTYMLVSRRKLVEGFFSVINDGLVAIDDFIWGVPLMVLILFGGILLTVRLRAVQFRQLPRALFVIV